MKELLRENSFPAGLFLYGGLLGLTTGGYFFAVVPPMLLYLAGSLSLKSQVDKELTYEDILLFRTKKEILDFLNGKVYQKSQLAEIDTLKTGLLWAMATFFALLFAYAYSTSHALISLIALPLLIRRKP